MFRQALLATLIAFAYAGPVVHAAGKQAAQVQSQARILDSAGMREAIQRGAIVWDVRKENDYNDGHIPGAVNVGDIGKVLRKEADEDYIPLAEMEKVLGAAGIDPAKEIVVYGDKGNPYAYFGLVTIEYLNGKQARVYHGGFDDWKAAGNPVATEPTKAEPVTLKLSVNPDVTVSTTDVIAAQKRKGVQIIDVRTDREYSGDDIRAIRGGHIPNATHIAYEQNWADPETPAKLAKKEVKNKDGMALKSVDQLKALYADLDPTKETIVYCQSGVRASETATVLKDLGFNKVKVYDASWLGYGNTLDAPADNVQFFNVGALKGRLADMQKRIDNLEKRLAESAKATK